MDDRDRGRPIRRRPLRILVVEDEVMNRTLFRAVLARATQPSLIGADLFEADTIKAARASLVADRPDIVVLDVRLPDGSGLELAREISGQPDRPRIVILSASVLASEQSAARAAGCDAFFGKPYRPTELLAMLAEVVDGAPDRLEDTPPG